MIKRSIYCFLICLSFPWNVVGQEDMNSIEKPKNTFSVEVGGLYYGFRDVGASDLYYEGLGGGQLSFEYRRAKDRWIDKFNICVGYGEARARVNNPNEFASVYSGLVSYSRIRKLNSSKHDRICYFLGGSVASNGVYISYPTIFSNNGDAYSLDVLSLGSVLGFRLSSLFNRNKGKSSFYAFSEIQLTSLNLRPGSYSGIGSERIFNNAKVTGFYNNFRISNSLTYQLTTKERGSWSMKYNWLLVWNSSRINTVLFAQHCLAVGYEFKIKSSKK